MLKPYVLLTVLTLGSGPHSQPGAQGFDTMEQCTQALVRWGGQMLEYSERNHLHIAWRPIVGVNTVGLVFEAGVATCQPYTQLTPEGKAAADNSP